MAVFDILASLVETPTGDFLVRVTVAPRLAGAIASRPDELRFSSEIDAEFGRERMIDEAIGRLRSRGDEVGSVIGPDWYGPDKTVVPR